MKTRNGFVSNSSSSSFVVVGELVDKIDANKLKKGVEYVCVGTYIDDGKDVFFVKPDMVEFINDFSKRFEIFENARASFDEEVLSFGKEYMNLVDSLSVCGGESDQGSSIDISDLKSRYLYD
jgi:hypothetical protein